jgi:hypothetical protein
MKNRTLIEAAGWYGVAAILGAYVLLNFGMIETNSWAYLTLNLTGSVAVLVDAWTARNWQPAVLNLVWAIVALIGLVRFFLAI